MSNIKRVVIIIVLLIFIVTISKYCQNSQEINRLTNEIQSLEEKIELAEEKNEDLAERLESLEGEEYIEREAREKLGLVKPGEILLIPIENDEEKNDSE